MFQAVLSNHLHPEYGVATVPFPIPRQEYDHIIELLRGLELGDVLARDCRVDEIVGGWPILKRLEKVAINVDELDYLAMRLDDFEPNEKAQFQAAAVTHGIFDMTEFIDLTFCCRKTTVIQDFTDLERIGRQHVLDMNGGVPRLEARDTDFTGEALTLLLQEHGAITPYGVLYENGMELEHRYDGRHFPVCPRNDHVLEAQLQTEEDPVWMFLPLSPMAFDRAVCRAGVGDPELVRPLVVQGDIPDCLEDVLSPEAMTLKNQNRLATLRDGLSDEALPLLKAAIEFAKPRGIAQYEALVERLDLFSFAPGAADAVGYGRCRVRDACGGELDESLKACIDFGKYGGQLMEQENGAFVSGGYISYHGALSLPELLEGASCERMENIGMKFG